MALRSAAVQVHGDVGTVEARRQAAARGACRRRDRRARPDGPAGRSAPARAAPARVPGVRVAARAAQGRRSAGRRARGHVAPRPRPLAPGRVSHGQEDSWTGTRRARAPRSRGAGRGRRRRRRRRRRAGSAVASGGGRYCSGRPSKNGVCMPPGTSSVTPTVTGQLGRQRAREADHAELAGAVGGGVGQRAEAERRGDRHDAPVASARRSGSAARTTAAVPSRLTRTTRSQGSAATSVQRAAGIGAGRGDDGRPGRWRPVAWSHGRLGGPAVGEIDEHVVDVAGGAVHVEHDGPSAALGHGGDHRGARAPTPRRSRAPFRRHAKPRRCTSCISSSWIVPRGRAAPRTGRPSRHHGLLGQLRGAVVAAFDEDVGAQPSSAARRVLVEHDDGVDAVERAEQGGPVGLADERPARPLRRRTEASELSSTTRQSPSRRACSSMATWPACSRSKQPPVATTVPPAGRTSATTTRRVDRRRRVGRVGRTIADRCARRRRRRNADAAADGGGDRLGRHRARGERAGAAMRRSGRRPRTGRRGTAVCRHDERGAARLDQEGAAGRRA